MSELCNRCTAERLSGCGDGRGYPGCQDPRGGFGNGERDNVRLREYLARNPHHSPALPPETVTAEAERLVCGRRGPDYGHPLDNHTATAEMWSAYMRRKYGVKIELDADDVCWMNIFQKASRDANAPKRDNLTDTAGYALNIDMIRTERDRRGNL